MQAGSRAWAHKIERRLADGLTVPAISRKWAEEVLGRPLLRKSPHVRPDAQDRAAGDDSFADAERYVQL